MDYIKYGRELLLVLYSFVLICGYLRREHLGKYLWYFLAAILFTFIVEVVGNLNLKLKIVNIALLYSVVILGAAISLFIAYFRNLSLSQFWKSVQLALLFANLVVVSLGLIFSEEFRYNLRGWPTYCSFLILIVSIIIFLYEMYNSDLILSLKSYFPFYVAFGLLFIYIGILPVMYFRFYIDSVADRKIFEILLYSVNGIGYGAILVGIFLARKVEIREIRYGGDGS